jgi:hypothetical protein
MMVQLTKEGSPRVVRGPSPSTCFDCREPASVLNVSLRMSQKTRVTRQTDGPCSTNKCAQTTLRRLCDPGGPYLRHVHRTLAFSGPLDSGKSATHGHNPSRTTGAELALHQTALRLCDATAFCAARTHAAYPRACAGRVSVSGQGERRGWRCPSGRGTAPAAAGTLAPWLSLPVAQCTAASFPH